MNVPIQMLVRIDPPIAALHEVEGVKLSITLGSTRARIYFPLNQSSPSAFNSGQKSWPTFPGKRVPYILTSKGKGVAVTMQLTHKPREFDIDSLMCLVGAVPTEVTTHQDATHFASALGQWITTFRSWMGFWTQAPQISVNRKFHPPVRGAYQMDGTWRRFLEKGETQVFVMGTALASPQMIDAAAAASSAHIEPKPEQLMYARAAENYLLRDTRRAVIDACTAAEMALGHAVRAHLRGRSVDESVIDSILKRANGIVEVFRLHLVATDSAVSLNRVMKELAGPRNDAAHDGLEPSAFVAKKALDAARQVLIEVSPVEDPQQLLQRVRRELRKSKLASN